MLELEDYSYEELKRKLIEMIREKSYQKKEITLSSGLKSNFYIDMKQTMLHAQGNYLICHMMLKKLEGIDISGVGGMSIGADPLSTGVSMLSLSQKKPLHAIYIRKEPKKHGTNEWVEGLNNFSKGEKVFILEDVVTTGGSSLKAIERAELAGFKVLGVLTCVDRQEGGREKIEEKGYKFISLVTKNEIESNSREI